MKNKLIWILLLVAALSLSVSCSVKEDRNICPCKLILDLSEVDTTLVKTLNIMVSEGRTVVLRDTVHSAVFSETYIRNVPHGSLRVNVWAGGENRMDERYGILIPYGCQCPPLYLHSFIADTTGEVCEEKVDVHKNYCRLTVKMEGVEEIPYSLTFRGNVDGYELDGLPSSGDFSCVAYMGDSGQVQSLLPRQTDASLLLDVDDGTPVSKTFAVGEYIQASGYDWLAPDLEDVTVVLDYQVTGIVISVQGWDKEYSYNITL